MRALVWIAALALLAPWPLGDAPPPGSDMTSPAPRPGFGTRLLGPIANLAASIEWVRYDIALEDGDYPLAYERAERALAIDPLSPHGWDLLASHLIFTRGGALLEQDPARRVDWIEAGLEVLRRGAEASRAPASLHMVRGQILAFFVAELAADPAALPWRGGEGAALAAGIAALEQAAALGHPKAHERKHQAAIAAQARAAARRR